MLALTLRTGEALEIEIPGLTPETITVRCTRAEDGRVSLGIDAPLKYRIVRENAKREK